MRIRVKEIPNVQIWGAESSALQDGGSRIAPRSRWDGICCGPHPLSPGRGPPIRHRILRCARITTIRSVCVPMFAHWSPYATESPWNRSFRQTLLTENIPCTAFASGRGGCALTPIWGSFVVERLQEQKNIFHEIAYVRTRINGLQGPPLRSKMWVMASSGIGTPVIPEDNLDNRMVMGGGLGARSRPRDQPAHRPTTSG
jgi:hypothetical protein